MSKKSIRRIGIIAWPDRSPHIAKAIERVEQWAQRHSNTMIIGLSSLSSLHPFFPLANEKKIGECNAFLAIGGDGTVLSAARLALGKKIDIIGVNTGRIGFLAEYPEQSLESALDLLAKGEYEVCPRTMLDATIFLGRKRLHRETVLNEIQIQAIGPKRMVDLETRLNGAHLTEYWADSLLVATPTGSTAYNLSAGGPIVHPMTDVFILNPVNPFSLSVRPLIIAAEHSLELQECNGEALELIPDGRKSIAVPPGARIVLEKSKWSTRFVQPNHAGFVEALREKLGWTGKPKRTGEVKPC